MTPEDDQITLHGLGLAARVGVPEMERATPQRLAADVTLWPVRPLSSLGDDLSRTIDYSAVAGVSRETVARGEFRLIESLAESLCTDILGCFPLRQVRVTLRKFILPDTESVSVTLTRRGDGLSVASTIP